MNYQFGTGDKGKTRNGSAYEVITSFKLNDGESLLVKIITVDKHERGFIYRGTSGRINFDGSNCDDGFDLIQPTLQRTVWLNVYEQITVLHESEAKAKGCYSHGALAVAIPVTFQYKKDNSNE